MTDGIPLLLCGAATKEQTDVYYMERCDYTMQGDHWSPKWLKTVLTESHEFQSH